MAIIIYYFVSIFTAIENIIVVCGEELFSPRKFLLKNCLVVINRFHSRTRK